MNSLMKNRVICLKSCVNYASKIVSQLNSITNHLSVLNTFKAKKPLAHFYMHSTLPDDNKKFIKNK